MLGCKETSYLDFNQIKLMRSKIRSAFHTALILGLIHSMPALAADDELDALALTSAPEADSAATAPQSTKLSIEGMFGSANQRYSDTERQIGRASLDFSHSARLAPAWSATISDRIDHSYPSDANVDATVNSLREAYLSWQPGGGDLVVEIGRINLRYGSGYGYNPTDFFRDGSLRTVTSTNPLAWRESRLGSVMLRGQQLWTGGSLSVAYSPSLVDRPNQSGWSPDLGSTNNRDRMVVALDTQFSQGVSSQLLAYKQAGHAPTLGASLTALLSNAAVGHIEWTRGAEPDLLSRALALPGSAATRNRLVGGVTYTTQSKLSVTAEYQYNGFALNQDNWSTLATLPMNQIAYLREAQRLQELASRQASLIYITQKSFGLKALDLTAFLRTNLGDRSRLVWFELRHHWVHTDLAFQFQHQSGGAASEFGLIPDSRVVQVLGSYYF
jgi:hypothetical protein